MCVCVCVCVRVCAHARLCLYVSVCGILYKIVNKKIKIGFHMQTLSSLPII